MPVPGPARGTLPTAPPPPAGPHPMAVDEVHGAAVAAAAGMQDGWPPSFPGAPNAAPGARCLALPCRLRGGMEGPWRLVALGGPSMVASPQPPLPAPACKRRPANINIYEMISACLIHN